MLSLTRVDHVLNMAGSYTQDFNCWGATMFIEQAKDRLGWVENPEISDWIQNEFEPIKKQAVEVGDVLCLFDTNKELKRMHLVHTAVCVGKNKFVHKLGQNRAQTDNLRGVLQHYAYCGNSYVFMRFKGGSNDN
jgi:hypothetical protein